MVGIRNTGGFSALAEGHPLAELDIGNPFKWAKFEEDFLAYDITQLIGGNPWKLTQTNGVDSIVGSTGVLKLVLGGADNDLALLQMTEAAFQTNAKKFYMQARVKLVLGSGGSVAANELFVGLTSAQTGAAFFATDGLSLTMDDALGFYKLDAEAAMSSVTGENDARSTDGSAHTPVDGAFFTVAVYFDGTTSNFYTGNAADGSDMTLQSSLSGNDATSVITPALYIKAGSAHANELHCDYINVYAER